MITEKDAQHAILPLVKANLSFPPEKDGRASLSAMLAQYARSYAHAEAVIAVWIQENPEWPKPSHLHDLCTETPDPALKNATEARESCRCCRGLGYVIVERGGVSGAAKCTHESEKSITGRL